MAFKVDTKTIEKTKLCQKCFSCLIEEGKDICKVKQCIDDKVLFIECDNNSYCAYQKSYGNSVYCECPVRKEIFRKYGK